MRRMAGAALALLGWMGASGGVSAQPTTGAGPSRPLAIVGDRAVMLDEITPWLLEAVGRVVLEEKVLDERLRGLAAARGLTVTEADLARERELLGQTLGAPAPGADGPGLSPDDVARAVASARSARGLGPARYDALVRRTALMRALVAPEVRVTDELIEDAYAVRYGDRVTVRVIVVGDAALAQRLRDEVTAVGAWEDGALARTLAFADRALRHSVDRSAPAGGLIEPLSLRDARYPAALRDAAHALKPGEVSQPVALPAVEGGGGGATDVPGGARAAQWMLVMLMDVEPAPQGAPTLESVRVLLEQQVRTGLERRAMDRLAQSLLADAPVLVMDRSLGWAWERR